MQPHLLPLVRVSARGLLPDPHRDRHASDVVHEARRGRPRYLRSARPQRLRRRSRQRRPPTPSGRPGTATRGRRNHPSPPGAVDRRRLAASDAQAARTPGSRPRPSRRVSSPRLRQLRRSARRRRGIEGGARPLGRPRGRRSPTTEQALEGSVPSHLRDPDSDGICRRASHVRAAFAIPPLVGVREQAAHRGGKTETIGQHLATSHGRAWPPEVSRESREPRCRLVPAESSGPGGTIARISLAPSRDERRTAPAPRRSSTRRRHRRDPRRDLRRPCNRRRTAGT